MGHADGDVFKRFLGSPARTSKYDLLYSLASNKYMNGGATIGGNVFSVEMKTSVETLSDCAATLSATSEVHRPRVVMAKASKSHMKLFSSSSSSSSPARNKNKANKQKTAQKKRRHSH